MDTIDEILQAIKDKQDEAKESLDQRMEDDFDLLALTPYKPANKGYESYTSSAPRNIFDKISDGLNRAQLSIQIKLAEDATEEQRRAASVGELYLFGALTAIDRRLRKRGEPPLREIMGFHIDCRGWYGLRALVYVPKGEQDTVFDVVPWDVMHSTWEQGPQGLLWAANQYVATRAQIEGSYPGKTIVARTAIVTDFWDCDRNGIIIGTDQWGKELTEHRIGHVPVLIGPVGSMPTIVRKDNSSTLDLQGDSVWAASRGLYEPKNKYVSWAMDRVKAAVAGSLVHYSADGTKALAGDPYLSFQEIKVSVDAKEKIEPLELPRLPAEAAVVMQVIDRDEQQSTLPYPLAYGGTDEAMSGRALSILDDNTLSVYSPRTGALARVYGWLCEELLHQFAAKGMKTADLSGYDPKEEFFSVKVKPKDINKSWYVDVRVEPRLPRDRDQEIGQALRATTKRGPDDIPLISRATAREEYMRLRDPDAEADKVLAEIGEGLQPIQVANIAAALQRRGKEELAEQVLILLAPAVNPATASGSQPATQPPAAGAPVGGPGGQVPPELVEAVLRALVSMGQEQLAEALATVLQGPSGGEVPPELVDAILQALISSGQEQLAQALFAALGGTANPAGAVNPQRV